MADDFSASGCSQDPILIYNLGAGKGGRKTEKEMRLSKGLNTNLEHALGRPVAQFYLQGSRGSPIANFSTSLSRHLRGVSIELSFSFPCTGCLFSLTPPIIFEGTKSDGLLGAQLFFDILQQMIVKG